MNKLTLVGSLLAMLVIGWVAGRWLGPGSGADAPAGGTAEREVLYWVAPMNPNFRSDEPGTSPTGMELIPVYADEADDSSGVRIAPHVVNNLGVRTGAVELGTLSRLVDTVGYVGFDEDTLRQINTRVDGWIERLAVKSEGERVEQGQVLFEINSPTLVSAQDEYLAALANENASLLQASRDRLLFLGMTPAQIDALRESRLASDLVQVFADSSGFVATLLVREGVHVTPHTTVMSLSELDTIWVQAEVFERQSAWIQEGQRAEVRLDYLPGRVWTGEVDYVYPELDQRTRTLKVRLRFDNPDETLRLNMFARVRIYGAETEPTLHIPREALIRGGLVNRVVVALGEGRFQSKAVEVGIEADDRVEIRSGLSLDDRIVTSGQFLIDSESNIEAELSRMEERDVAADGDSAMDAMAPAAAEELEVDVP